MVLISPKSRRGHVRPGSQPRVGRNDIPSSRLPTPHSGGAPWKPESPPLSLFCLWSPPLMGQLGLCGDSGRSVYSGGRKRGESGQAELLRPLVPCHRTWSKGLGQRWPAAGESAPFFLPMVGRPFGYWPKRVIFQVEPSGPCPPWAWQGH